MASGGLICMGAFVGLSGPGSCGISLAMETKPMRDEMNSKPEGHTRDRDDHDLFKGRCEVPPNIN